MATVLLTFTDRGNSFAYTTGCVPVCHVGVLWLNP